MKPFFPVLYQGSHKLREYFEGWYFKQTTRASDASTGESRTISFIPGISRSPAGDKAFVQMIDGATGLTKFFPFPVGDFYASDEPFEVRVVDNRFSLSGLRLALADAEVSIDAELSYGPTTKIKRSPVWPGIMGPYSFVPFMECYHGVASLDHEVNGNVSIRNHADEPGSGKISFDGARGYIEKDWGRSMPASWIWIQTNTFERTLGPASFFFSLARIPWAGGYFNGFLSILYAGGVEYRFATYTGARLELLEVSGQSVRILVRGARHKLEVLVRRNHEGSLAAPVKGAMDRRISESADSYVRVILKSRYGDDSVFDSASTASGVEIVGDVKTLVP